MPRWLRDTMVAGVTATVVALLFVVAWPRASAQPARPARTHDGKPNLNGIWQAVNAANWNLLGHSAAPGVVPQQGAIGAVPAGLSVVEGNEIPYQPWAAEKQKENFKNRMTQDPEAKCYMPGVPRAMHIPYPFQIVQAPSIILMAFEFASTNRRVFLDAKQDAPVDSWMGTSNGHWEGDTLVIDSFGFNGQAWLDRSGNFHSDALHVVERITPGGPDHLRYEATIEDPMVFTRPWKVSMPLYRRTDPGMRLLEFKCVEFAEEMLYGHLRPAQ
jgi:hypothetical protein